ncbi:MAG TPA: hypothetical protein VEA59_05790 [Patescibacteria group bacterium]|nr:hypothetical protein [Patescibacteria group bacterium]
MERHEGPEESEIKIPERLVVLDASAEGESEARRRAGERISKERAEAGRLKRMLLNVMEGGYRKKYLEEERRKIFGFEKKQNIFGRIFNRRTDERRVGEETFTGDRVTTQQELNAQASRFADNELAAMLSPEEAASVRIEGPRERIVDLIADYAAGRLNEAAFLQRKNLIFSEEGIAGHNLRARENKGLMIADNLLDAAKEFRKWRNAEIAGERTADLDNRLKAQLRAMGMDFGTTGSTIRTQETLDRVERVIDYMERNPILGRLPIGGEALAFGASLAGSAFKWFSRSAARSAVPIVGGALVAGYFGAKTRGKQMEQDRALYNTQNELSAHTPGNDLERKFVKAYKTKSVGEMVAAMDAALHAIEGMESVSIESKHRLIEAVADAEARFRIHHLSGREGKGLINFSKTGLAGDVGRVRNLLELERKIAQSIRVISAGPAGTDGHPTLDSDAIVAYNTIFHDTQNRLLSEAEAVDADFQKLKRTEQMKAFGKSALTAGTVGLATQAIHGWYTGRDSLLGAVARKAYNFIHEKTGWGSPWGAPGERSTTLQVDSNPATGYSLEANPDIEEGTKEYEQMLKNIEAAPTFYQSLGLEIHPPVGTHFELVEGDATKQLLVDESGRELGKFQVMNYGTQENPIYKLDYIPGSSPAGVTVELQTGGGVAAEGGLKKLFGGEEFKGKLLGYLDNKTRAFDLNEIRMDGVVRGDSVDINMNNLLQHGSINSSLRPDIAVELKAGNIAALITVDGKQVIAHLDEKGHAIFKGDKIAEVFHMKGGNIEHSAQSLQTIVLDGKGGYHVINTVPGSGTWHGEVPQAAVGGGTGTNIIVTESGKEWASGVVGYYNARKEEKWGMKPKEKKKKGHGHGHGGHGDHGGGDGHHEAGHGAAHAETHPAEEKDKEKKNYKSITIPVEFLENESLRREKPRARILDALAKVEVHKDHVAAIAGSADARTRFFEDLVKMLSHIKDPAKITGKVRLGDTTARITGDGLNFLKIRWNVGDRNNVRKTLMDIEHAFKDSTEDIPEFAPGVTVTTSEAAEVASPALHDMTVTSEDVRSVVERRATGTLERGERETRERALIADIAVVFKFQEPYQGGAAASRAKNIVLQALPELDLEELINRGIEIVFTDNPPAVAVENKLHLRRNVSAESLLNSIRAKFSIERLSLPTPEARVEVAGYSETSGISTDTVEELYHIDKTDERGNPSEAFSNLYKQISKFRFENNLSPTDAAHARKLVLQAVGASNYEAIPNKIFFVGTHEPHDLPANGVFIRFGTSGGTLARLHEANVLGPDIEKLMSPESRTWNSGLITVRPNFVKSKIAGISDERAEKIASIASKVEISNLVRSEQRNATIQKLIDAFARLPLNFSTDDFQIQMRVDPKTETRYYTKGVILYLKGYDDYRVWAEAIGKAIGEEVSRDPIREPAPEVVLETNQLVYEGGDKKLLAGFGYSEENTQVADRLKGAISRVELSKDIDPSDLETMEAISKVLGALNARKLSAVNKKLIIVTDLNAVPAADRSKNFYVQFPEAGTADKASELIGRVEATNRDILYRENERLEPLPPEAQISEMDAGAINSVEARDALAAVLAGTKREARIKKLIQENFKVSRSLRLAEQKQIIAKVVDFASRIDITKDLKNVRFFIHDSPTRKMSIDDKDVLILNIAGSAEDWVSDVRDEYSDVVFYEKIPDRAKGAWQLNLNRRGMKDRLIAAGVSVSGESEANIREFLDSVLDNRSHEGQFLKFADDFEFNPGAEADDEKLRAFAVVLFKYAMPHVSDARNSFVYMSNRLIRSDDQFGPSKKDKILMLGGIAVK